VKSDLTDKVFPLALFHKDVGTSRRLCERFVGDGIEMGHNGEFYPSLSTPYLGGEPFVEDYRERVAKKTSARGEKFALIPLERLARGVGANLPLEMLRSPTQVRKVTAVRQEFVLNAVKMGHRLSAVAEFLPCSQSAISKIIARSL
jgi:hypothetical protein